VDTEFALEAEVEAQLGVCTKGLLILHCQMHTVDRGDAAGLGGDHQGAACVVDDAARGVGLAQTHAEREVRVAEAQRFGPRVARPIANAWRSRGLSTITAAARAAVRPLSSSFK